MAHDHAAGQNSILVSIVINNYNYGQFLGDAIASALSQLYEQTEVIVVDDGSSDSSRQLIFSFGDKITAVLKENGGQASAFNAGFDVCRGQIVIFLDADDVLLPTAAGLVADALLANPGAGKVMYRMEVIDAAGTPTGVHKPAQYLELRGGDLRRATLTSPFDQIWMATSGNAFPARVLRETMPMPEGEYRLSADWYLSHLSTLLGPVVFLEDVGAYYRVHGANSHEVARFSLEQIRKTIVYMRTTACDIARVAQRLGLYSPLGPADEILSVSYVATRLVSMRLEPAKHPLAGDNLWKILADAGHAVSRRFDVGLQMKAVYLLWFGLAAVAPQRFIPRLAEYFFLPETRRWAGGFLSKFH